MVRDFSELLSNCTFRSEIDHVWMKQCLRWVVRVLEKRREDLSASLRSAKAVAKYIERIPRSVRVGRCCAICQNDRFELTVGGTLGSGQHTHMGLGAGRKET